MILDYLGQLDSIMRVFLRRRRDGPRRRRRFGDGSHSQSHKVVCWLGVWKEPRNAGVPRSGRRHKNEFSYRTPRRDQPYGPITDL